MKKIWINGRQIETDKDELTYHDIVELAGLRPRNDYTMCFMWVPPKRDERKGALTYGVNDGILCHHETLVIENIGTYRIDVCLTNNA